MAMAVARDAGREHHQSQAITQDSGLKAGKKALMGI